MNLVETGSIAVAALPLAELRAHLRLGTGFGEDSLQDGVLEGFLRAAIAGIEAQIGKVLIARDFVQTIDQWTGQAQHVLPMAPVRLILQVALRRSSGAEEVVAADRYWLQGDMHRPKLRSVGSCLPAVPEGGEALVSFTAGFGIWSDVPADLQQAVFLLAAHYYEYRDETALGRGCMPFGVTSLLNRFRPIRLGFGGL